MDQLAAVTAQHTKLPPCQTDTGSTRGIEIPLACKPKLPGTRGSFSPDEAKPHPIVGSLRDAARVAVAVGRTPKGSFYGM